MLLFILRNGILLIRELRFQLHRMSCIINWCILCVNILTYIIYIINTSQKN